MKKVILLIFLLFAITKENDLILEKVANSKYSNIELTDNNIIISYNGGLSKYSYSLKLISEIPIEELELNSYSEIHKINDNMLIIESSRAIYLLENDSIKYKINFDSISYFRQVLIIDSNTYLVLKVELTSSIIEYCLFNTDSNTPIKTEKSSSGYSYYTCTLSSLSNKKYIVCFLIEEIDMYYSIFDSNLNKIVQEAKINLRENNSKLYYIYSISITDNRIILLINSLKESPLRRLVKEESLRRLVIEEDIINKSILEIFEIREISGNLQLDLVNTEEYVIYDQTYMGINVFHMRKLDEGEFVIVFPVNESKKDYYFSIMEYKNDILTVKEEYQNIPLSFKYEIQGLKFVKINSEFIISFYYFNDEEEEEIQEVFISYLTTKSCQDFKISAYTHTQDNIDFSKYISYDLIPSEPDFQKMKIDKIDTYLSQIYFSYDNNSIEYENFYEFKNWKYEIGRKTGIFDVFYTVFSSNDYMNKTCKITFNITIDNSKYNLEDEIKEKLEELKENFEENSQNNAIYDFSKYKISFYNTSKISIDNVIKKEDTSNILLKNCEDIIRKNYEILEDEILNIIQVEIKREDSISVQVEYEIYNKYYEQLNLEICKNEILQIGIPYNYKNVQDDINFEKKYEAALKYNFDILNPNSSFYNDLCTPFDSEYVTDIIIEDRKQYYYLPQLLCEDNCFYSHYNSSNKKIICNCPAKTEPKYNTIYRRLSSNIINSSFYKKVKNVNVKVLKCLGKSFSNLGSNLFFWLIIIIFIIFVFFSYLASLLDVKTDKKKIVKIELKEFGCELPYQNSSYTDSELAVMPYELAKIYDKRNFFQMYLGIIKYNHLISYTFIIKENSNNIFLKMAMFLLFIILLFLMNLFFFTDKDFTNFYLRDKKYNFGNELVKSIYALIICLLINMIVRILLRDTKNQDNINKTINEINSINYTNVEMNIPKEKSNKKIIIFSIIGIVFIIFTFFYLTSFGGIFINSQKYLFIRILYSFILSIIIPFILCIIYSSLRYLSLFLRCGLLYKIILIAQNF